MDDLVAFLRRLRERAGYSQNELSLKAGLNETYYGKIEGGSRHPSPKALLSVLAALACSTDERQQALRLFAVSRMPGFLEELLARPQPGTAVPPVAPSRKRRRVTRRGLRAWWLVPAASVALLGSPLRAEAGRLITEWPAVSRDSVAFGRRRDEAA